METRDTGTQHKLRMPPELKEKLFVSAKEMNRSLNAEIVDRLEKSFDALSPESEEAIKKLHKELREDLIAQSYKVAKHRYEERRLIALDQMYIRFDLQAASHRFLIKKIENGTFIGEYETNPIDQVLIKHKILAANAQEQVDQVKAEMKRIYKESNIDPRFAYDNELQSLIKIIEEKPPE